MLSTTDPNTNTTAQLYAGFRATTSDISVFENGPQIEYEVELTVPLTCFYLVSQPDENIACRVVIQIVIPEDRSSSGCVFVMI